MNAYLHFIKEITQPAADIKALVYRRKYAVVLSKEQLIRLYETYFKTIIATDPYFVFTYKEEDEHELLFLLRVHFQLWIEHDTLKQHIKVYRDFPTQFVVIKEVNKSNHRFTPNTFPLDTIMYFAHSNYGTVNMLQGVPLATSLEVVEGTQIIPSTQINYDYIRAVNFQFFVFN